MLAAKTLDAADWAMIFVSPAIYWVMSTFFFVLSALKITSVELHRLPTYNRSKNRVTVGSVMGHVAIQHVLQAFVATVLAIATKTSETREMESPVVFVAKLALGAIFLDTYQYWWHRWMHTNKWLYRNFHSVHHRLTVPYAYGALYNHPVEGFIMDILGSAIPAALLGILVCSLTLSDIFARHASLDSHIFLFNRYNQDSRRSLRIRTSLRYPSNRLSEQRRISRHSSLGQGAAIQL